MCADRKGSRVQWLHTPHRAAPSPRQGPGPGGVSEVVWQLWQDHLTWRLPGTACHLGPEASPISSSSPGEALHLQLAFPRPLPAPVFSCSAVAGWEGLGLEPQRRE